MRPVIDNLEQILDSDEKKRYEDEDELSDKIAEIFERGIIQTEALNFIRGRSIAKTYLIIDEAQNMTPNQVKGIITRAGQERRSYCWEIRSRSTGPFWMKGQMV